MFFVSETKLEPSYVKLMKFRYKRHLVVYVTGWQQLPVNLRNRWRRISRDRSWQWPNFKFLALL